MTDESNSIKVGDYVRWEWDCRWIEGSVWMVDDGIAHLTVDRDSGGRSAHVEFVLTKNCRRIPRPGEVAVTAPAPLKVGDRVRWLPDFADDQRYSNCVVIGPDGPFDPTKIQIVSLSGPRWSSVHGHVGDEVVSPTGRLVKLGPASHYDEVTATQAKASRAVVNAASPAPTLIDGITPAQCLDYYTSNMHEGRGGLYSWHHTTLTPAQLAVAREMWSAAVRALVTASKDEDRQREVSVRVEVDLD